MLIFILLGYAAAQAVPGPMFTMASFAADASLRLGVLSLDVGGDCDSRRYFYRVVTYVECSKCMAGVVSPCALFVLQWAAERSGSRHINSACYTPFGTSSLVSWWMLLLWA